MTTTHSFANIRNRAEQHNLNTELSRIEREKQTELRMLKTEKLKFRSKYSKVSAIYLNEPSEVRMYETHTPGFCYRRNGEQKNSQQTPVEPSIDFKHIHYLIFTNGEVDINKILCLHLVSAHRTETLTPPRRKISYICKEHSPLERLIERSKKGFSNFEKLSNLLPLYTLELIEPGAMGESGSTLINDGRLAARILINEKVRELMNTVISALEQSNNEKLEKLKAIANDTSLVKKILKKPETEEFLDMLFNHSLINSCESFVLTPPFRIKTRDLDIKTISGSVEHLVKHIRQNVLQISSQNVWGRLKQVELFNSILQSKISSTSSTIVKMEQNRQTNEAISRPTKLSRFDLPTKKPPSRKSSEEEDVQSDLSNVNFIARNIAAASKVKRIEYDVDEDEIIPSKRPSFDSSRSKRRSLEPPIVLKPNVQNFLPPVVESIEEKASVEQEKTEKKESETISESVSDDSGNRPRKQRSVDSHESKYHIKQTTCPACMEKWKTPLPSPKTPRVKVSTVLGENEYSALKTNSQHRVSMLISKEIYKLHSYDRKYSMENEAIKTPVFKKRENEHDKLEVVHLNPIDLAKIEQEIKEKETQKKLEKFLQKLV